MSFTTQDTGSVAETRTADTRVALNRAHTAPGIRDAVSSFCQKRPSGTCRSNSVFMILGFIHEQLRQGLRLLPTHVDSHRCFSHIPASQHRAVGRTLSLHCPAADVFFEAWFTSMPRESQQLNEVAANELRTVLSTPILRRFDQGRMISEALLRWQLSACATRQQPKSERSGSSQSLVRCGTWIYLGLLTGGPSFEVVQFDCTCYRNNLTIHRQNRLR